MEDGQYLYVVTEYASGGEIFGKYSKQIDGAINK